MATESAQYKTFTHLARQYCSAIEDSSVRGREGLRTISNLLLPLYSAGMQLAEVKEANHLKRSIEHAHSQALYMALQERLPVDLYWDTFDPLTNPPTSLVAGSLANDLVDVWRDVKNGLIAIDTQSGPPARDVWWEWQFGFHSHWGAHAVSALRILYHALRDTD